LRRPVSKSLDKVELTQKLLDAQLGMLDIVGQLTAAVQENIDLKEKNVSTLAPGEAWERRTVPE
jgi:hypothetical protein